MVGWILTFPGATDRKQKRAKSICGPLPELSSLPLSSAEEASKGTMTVTMIAVAGADLGSHIHKRRRRGLRQLQVDSQVAHVNSVRNVDRHRLIVTGQFAIASHQNQRIV